MQIYSVHHQLRQLKYSTSSSGDLLIIGLPPAASLLSVLASHVLPCFNLLYRIFYVFFEPSCLFLPVTDSDELD